MQQGHAYEEVDGMFSALNISSIFEDIEATSPMLNKILRDLLEWRKSTVGRPRDHRDVRVILMVICFTWIEIPPSILHCEGLHRVARYSEGTVPSDPL